MATGTDALNALLEKMGRTNDLELTLTQVRFGDTINREADGDKKLHRTLSASGKFFQHVGYKPLTVAGRSLDELRMDVSIVFVPSPTFMSWTPGPLGAVSFTKSEVPEIGGTLDTTFVLPMELRERFADRTNLPRITLTLDGFTDLGEKGKVWDTENGKRLLITQCYMGDETLETIQARNASLEHGDERVRESVLEFLGYARNRFDDWSRMFNKWQRNAFWMFVVVVLILVLLLKH